MTFGRTVESLPSAPARDEHAVHVLRRPTSARSSVIVIVVGDRHDGRPRPVREPHPPRPRHPGRGARLRDGAADGRQHRPGRHADLPPRRHHGGSRGVCSTDHLRGHRATTSASSSASRRSPPPCSAASATSAAPFSVASAGPHRELRLGVFGAEWKDVDRVRRARPRAACSGRPGCSASRSGGRGHERPHRLEPGFVQVAQRHVAPWAAGGSGCRVGAAG